MKKENEPNISPRHPPKRIPKAIPFSFSLEPQEIIKSFVSVPEKSKFLKELTAVQPLYLSRIAKQITSALSITDDELRLSTETEKAKQKLSEALHSLEANDKNEDEQFQMAGAILSDVLTKNTLKHISDKVNKEARERLLNDDDFYKLFELPQCKMVIVSIDIRRSTQLMLDCNEPINFATFISSLTEKIKETIVENYGIFDKFTGDGVLAYFPHYYSGEHAIFYALKAAQECHNIFSEHYDEYRTFFHVIRKDTGLGIGIDFGDVFTIKLTDSLQIVGKPVVYACRLSGAPARNTYINQNAYTEFITHCKHKFTSKTVKLDIKNEGPISAFSIKINYNKFPFKRPDWDELMRTYLK